MRNSTTRSSWLIALALATLLSSCGEETKLTTISQEALAHYSEGILHMEKFYYVQAKSEFENAIRTDSSFAMAYARLAMVHNRTYNEVSAKAEIAKALAKSTAATDREKMFIRMLDRLIHFKYTEAGAVADSIIAMTPDDGELYFLRGMMYEYAKDFDAALETYRKGAEADTSFALNTMSLGYAYSYRGDFDKAIDAMERYIQLVPNEPDPRASLADVLMRVGRYDDAYAQYKKSLELKPDYWYSIEMIGTVYIIWGRLNDADRQFDLAVEKTVINNQTRASHLATEGVLNYHRGKYDETIRLCEQSLALDSTSAKAAYVSVSALAKLKKFKEAHQMVEAIRQELERRNLLGTSAMFDFHLLRARVFEEEKLLDEALAECDSAMEYGVELRRSQVYHCIGKIAFAKGEYDRALDALEGALRYNANDPEALLTLTKVYKALGDKHMTDALGRRLFDTWRNADPDYQNLIELKKLWGKNPPRPSAT